MLLKVGDKVRILEGVPIENQELRPGHIGTVTIMDYGPCPKKGNRAICYAHGNACVGVLRRVSVKLDMQLNCLDEWDNHIHLDTDNWPEETSCTDLVMRILEPLKMRSAVEERAVEKWADFLTDKLNDAYIAWRKEARRDFTDAELDVIALQVHKDYMRTDPAAAFAPKTDDDPVRP